MVEAVPDQVWIGASYQAQPAMGEQRLSGTVVIAGIAEKAGFYQTLPDIVRAGIRWRMKHAPLEFRLFGDLTRWSLMKSQCVVQDPFTCQIRPNGSDATAGGDVAANLVRNWNDSYGGRLGVTYHASSDIDLLLGAGFETAAIPDETMTPEISDANNFSGTLGARFQFTRGLFFTASYTHQQFLNRDNTGKSTLALRSNGQPVQYPTVQEDGGGKYTQWISYAVGNLEAFFP